MKKVSLAVLFSLGCTLAEAGTVTVQVFSTEDQKPLGEVIFEDTDYGLLVKPNLKGLPAGLHGFHLHEKPSCADKGMAAGGHFDPQNTKSHLGPYAEGHLGDLPVLYVDEQHQASTPTLAPRLSTKDLVNLSLMIHQGADNYSNEPPLGGGGKRIGCGVIGYTDKKTSK